jgi:alanyl-tRNA synthetase
MRSSEIRKAFLDYFRSRSHEIVRSSSLIPRNDPTLLFTNAGMVQFKQVFLGDKKHPYLRAASSQKCMRAGGKHSDLENVGYTARHHTFFEMLGNFSFGNYFKEEAIVYAWELLTVNFGLPVDKLWVTVFEEDDESEEIWKEVIGISENKIVRLGAKDNFWQMGDTGPCGPCSEILIDQGKEISCGKPDCAVGCDCDRYLELWNLVFMQYDRDSSGNLNPLPKPSIDTGMGLERISAVLQGKTSNFDSDLFIPIISAITALSPIEYGSDIKADTSVKVIADHIRSISFLLSEGLIPSNEGRGYVLRRIIRRASRYTRNLNIDEPVLHTLCDSVTDTLGEAYPELKDENSRVKKILRLEEERFSKTLEHGLSMIDALVQSLKDSGQMTIPGEELFRLYDTYGFPLDIARDIAAESNLSIDEDGFKREMEIQKTRARASWTGEETAVASVYIDIAKQIGQTEFAGYETLETEASVLAIIINGQLADELKGGDEGELLLDRSSFYAEAGGQAGDTGELHSETIRATVLDTVKPVDGLHVHKVRLRQGTVKKDDRLICTVDAEKRASTMRNHTATHLLHSSLRMLLGEHVKQSGSYVAPDRFRFDFTHFDALSNETVEALENDVNDNILHNIKVETSVMDTDEAIKSGAIALFGEKYGSTVRIVTVSGVSTELCGGTHVSSTGDIGLFKVLSEGSLASGIRRIEAVTGKKAFEHLRQQERELKNISEIIKASENPSEKLNKIISEMKELERELEKHKSQAAVTRSGEIIDKVREINGIKAVAQRIDGLGQKDLRGLADNIRDRMGSGVLVLASVKNGQASLVAMVTKDLVANYHAGEILRLIAAAAGGRGGGKADLAQGGTKEIKKLDKALKSLYDILKK